MKIYILKAKENLPDYDNPWKPWYDKCFGQVICANSPLQARKMASKEAEAEDPLVWLNSYYTTCRVLVPTTKAKVILLDIRMA